MIHNTRISIDDVDISGYLKTVPFDASPLKFLETFSDATYSDKLLPQDIIDRVAEEAGITSEQAEAAIWAWIAEDEA